MIEILQSTRSWRMIFLIYGQVIKRSYVATYEIWRGPFLPLFFEAERKEKRRR